MFWPVATLIFAGWAFVTSSLYFHSDQQRTTAEHDRDDALAEHATCVDQSNRIGRLEAENAALRGMLGNKDHDLHAAWRDACRERDAAIEHAQQVVVELQELRRRFGRAVGHPSADTDPTPPHGIERPALTIVEGL